MQFQTPVLIFASLILVVLAVYVQRLATKGSKYFAGLMAASGWMALMAGIETALLEPQQKIIAAKITYIGAVMLGPMWFLFVARYVELSKKIIKRAGALFTVIGITILTFVFTNEIHNWAWQSIVPASSQPGSALIYHHGIVIYSLAGYSYLLLVVGSIMLVRHIARTKELKGNKVALVLIGVTFPIVINVLYLMNPDFFQGLEVTSLSFLVTGALLVLSVFRYKFLALVPLARETFYQNIDAGVVVVNPQHQVVDCNTTARRIFQNQLSVGDHINQPSLQRIVDLSAVMDGAGNLVVYSEPNDKWFDIRANALHKKGATVAGQMIVLHDVTQLKNVQTQIMSEEKFFSEVTNFNPDPTYVIDRQGRVVIWNKAMEKLTGIDASKMIGKGDYEYAVPFYGSAKPMLANLALVPDPRKSELWSSFADASVKQEDGKLTQVQRNTHLAPAGVYLWSIAQPLYDKQGGIIFAIETIRDVSDDKRHEVEMKQNIAQLEKLNQVLVTRELRMRELKKKLERYEGHSSDTGPKPAGK